MRCSLAASSVLVVLGLVIVVGGSCSDRAPRSGDSPGTAAARLPSHAIAFPLEGLQPGLMRLERVFPDLTLHRPVLITHAGDGTDRLFVVEQRGHVVVFPNLPNVRTVKVFLDISGKVFATADEAGLLGLAFHPDYALNGLFYVSYFRVAGGRRDMVVAEYRVSATDPDRADPASERVLLEVPQPAANHNGGTVAFGPDRMLYASFGDGGGVDDPNRNGQDRTNLLSTIVRIDPLGRTGALPYRIPADNPFVGAGGGVREEIWAYGLRNPYRFAFDRVTGELWAGDVGSYRAEEIDVVQRGGNYGWSVFEGGVAINNPNNLPSSAFDAPVHAYDGSIGRCVIGGVVYGGQAHPPLRGVYVYGDYVGGLVFGLVRQPSGPPITATLGVALGLTSISEDEHGEILVTAIDGTIRRLVSKMPPSRPFPLKLSETRFFVDLASLEPVPGVVGYAVMAPLWSDDASKQRWIALPNAGRIGFDPVEAWDFPVGTVLAKHFELEMQVGNPASRRRLETRFLVHEVGGWAGYTYVWNANGTDADLLTLPRGLDRTYTIQDPSAPNGTRRQTWHFPSMSECMQCHTHARGHVLGVRTGQLNVPPHMAGQRTNHLERFNDLHMFTQDIGPAGQYGHWFDPADGTRSDGERARSYLAANCAHCHLPGGPTQATFDVRFRTPDAGMHAIGVRPNFGMGLADPYIIEKNDKSQSVLWVRMGRLDNTRMPKIGSEHVDAAGVELIGRWIDGMR